ncbi:hypothetical protein [Pseudomonas fluorescens]|uniref:hypothetical protein n=1 Tax=Pseudomonas fluorescens TaxID=294 RepID=UPI001BEB0397|nr:hypothetical protein [Pseudomonas fluorescens]MBT2374407.1 hypothetical protein [Pseudomonas fluorescens]
MKTANKRDEFLQSTINVLRLRTGSHCSNPTCDAPTSAPCGALGITSEGVAAHIHAASPGGKRYDEKMTREERMHFDNGLWLCANCSIMIDRDVDLFPASKLRVWKTQAEKRAMERLGKKPPSPDDGIALLLQATTQMPSKTFLANAITNVHRANEIYLEGLDNRFSVTSSLIKGVSCFEINAKESVDVRFKVKMNASPGYLDGYRALIDHGKSLEIDICDTSVEGSKLLEHIFSAEDRNVGKLVLTPATHHVLARIELIDPKTNMVDFFTEMPGEITAGRKSMRFEGQAMEGLINISFNKKFTSEGGPQTLKLNLDLNQWESSPLCRLPYLSKMAKLYERLVAGWELSVILELKGEVVFGGVSQFGSCASEIKHMNALLTYTTLARSVSMLLGKQVYFTRHVTFTSADIADLDDVRLTLEGLGQIPRKNAKKSLSFDVIYDSKLEQISVFKSGEPISMRFVQNEEDALAIFGQLIRLPKLVLYVKGVTIKIRNKSTQFKDGDPISLRLKPVKEFSMVKRFEVETVGLMA